MAYTFALRPSVVIPTLNEARNIGAFRGMSWSTDAVYRQMLEKARSLGLRVHEGNRHYDVDTPEDLALLMRGLEANPGLSPRVAKRWGYDIPASRALGC